MVLNYIRELKRGKENKHVQKSQSQGFFCLATMDVVEVQETALP